MGALHTDVAENILVNATGEDQQVVGAQRINIGGHFFE